MKPRKPDYLDDPWASVVIAMLTAVGGLVMVAIAVLAWVLTFGEWVQLP